MEKGIRVPKIFKQALVALLGKPGGGERPIALLPMLYRVWMRLRKSLVTGWDDKKHEFWDTAVTGSSPLQATYRRLCMDETAVLQKASVASCLWDMAKFYDSIDWRVLAVQAPKHGYPIRVLAIGMIVHASPRMLKDRHAVSLPCQAFAGIMAGTRKPTRLRNVSSMTSWNTFIRSGQERGASRMLMIWLRLLGVLSLEFCRH